MTKMSNYYWTVIWFVHDDHDHDHLATDDHDSSSFELILSFEFIILNYYIQHN